ncbi:YdgH/BhsA/McbA-like domain containing protein [Pantoea sp. A4]|uniref:YdgH/BhsA/McbA-like domain containing protein n=1 Tax=Pantoea sp. A4 TaxID=1225184 RepID=UPI00036877BB|nr:YdgH/BhsA/McbA-like domain containing protein [Pantoea sp. A4]
MNVAKLLVAGVMLGAMSFSVLAAEEVTKEVVESKNLVKIGTVNTSDKDAPMDLHKSLSKKADDLGGKYYLIIAGREHGKFAATADVYKDKE